jgi:hypothetical protein
MLQSMVMVIVIVRQDLEGVLLQGKKQVMIVVK